MHLSSKLRKIENENQLSFRFFFEDDGIKEKVYIPKSTQLLKIMVTVPNHDYQELMISFGQMNIYVRSSIK